MNSKPFHWRNRTSFFQAIQITSNLHYHYYASFSSRIPTFKKTSYWQGSVLHIDSNPLLRQVAGEAPKDDRLAPLRLPSCSEHTNFRSKPKKLGSPLKHQVPKFQIRKYPFSEKDKKSQIIKVRPELLKSGKLNSCRLTSSQVCLLSEFVEVGSSTPHHPWLKRAL